MGEPVYLHGRALASALGADLDAALDCLRHGGVAPRTLDAAPGERWPYFAIDDDTPDWYARAERQIRHVIAESGADADRSAPLFVASSSLNVGALESGAPFLPDCQQFVERVAQWIDWQGPVIWVSTACTSAMVALLDACHLIRDGQATRAVVLGIELFNRFSSAGFGAMQLLDAAAARPLAADRAGLVLGEAVSALVLSKEPSRWRVCGGNNRIDGSNPAGANRRSVEHMVRNALADSRIDSSELGLIKLQAAGSPHNDTEEIAGLQAACEALPPVTTLKTCLGHTLGAAGAAEIALLTGCIDTGVTIPLPDGDIDPAFDLTLTRQLPTSRYVLAIILGFGGGHTGVVLENMGAPR